LREAGETLEIKVLGLANIADDVDPELPRETIDSVIVNEQMRRGMAEAGHLRRQRTALQRVLPPGLKLAVRVCVWSLEPASLPFVLRSVLACEGGAAGEGSEFPCEVLYLGRNDE
jgi:hypothetical protein